ncbi:APC family permease [Nocardioides mangrovicus]|uniref:APC family permease n=1 Tax=Nocardioides mangrovicus TaxID=2478913 RepID=A0A3L8NYB3_9ACTN|nr:APC family permease [Nocardioides mangrovicus]RLV47831.1 APC family permease [Nocardioides mangrovicus]
MAELTGDAADRSLTASPPPTGALSARAMGLPGVIFTILAGAAPLYAMLFNVPVTVNGAGYAAPIAFVIATIALVVFSVGYVRMSQKVRSAGGFYSFVTAGLGRVPGLGTAYVVSVCYIVFCAAIIGPTAYFTHGTLQHWFGATVPTWVLVFVILGLSLALSWFHVGLAARVLSTLMVLELVGLAVFVVVVAVHGGADGLSARPLDPSAFFDNAQAVKVFGASAAGIALFGAFWSWVGFEMAPNYAEESRDPATVGKRAMYITVIGLGVVYTVVSFFFVNGWGVGQVSDAVLAQFKGTYDSAFYPLTDRYGSSALTEYFRVLTMTSGFAAQLAFFNTASRYLFSLGREGLLPSWLAQTHPRHHSPYRASTAVAVVAGLYMLGFVIADPSTEATLTKLGTWSPLLGVMGLLAVQALVSVAVIRYFLVAARADFSVWHTLVAPLLGLAAMVAALFLLLTNTGALSGAGDATFIRAMPFVIVALFVVGMVTALVWRSREDPRYAAIGSFTTFHD